MSRGLRLIPFGQLVERLLAEHKNGNCFGVRGGYVPKGLGCGRVFAGVGVSAGPHTQMAQNIMSAYYAGARFFELRTVQHLAGAALPVIRPSIRGGDACFHCEWSTPLTADEAFAEYVKAWFLIKAFAREWSLGSADGFTFCMSAGYELDSLMQPQIMQFIRHMRDASGTAIFEECRAWLLEHIGLFSNIDADYIHSVSPHISSRIVLNTLHGCAPYEMEQMADMLMGEYGLHTVFGCGVTLLEYETVRSVLDRLGYDDICCIKNYFDEDIRYYDAVPLFIRLRRKAADKGLRFALKVSGPLAAETGMSGLAAREVSVSGKPLYPLALELAARLARDTKGLIPIVFSGGCRAENIGDIISAGLYPTAAASLFESGGYGNLARMARAASDISRPDCPDAELLRQLAEKAVSDSFYSVSDYKSKKPALSIPIPLFACQINPCTSGADSVRRLCCDVCPNRANITLNLRGQFQVIHIDYMCSGCGNCLHVCPYKSSPSEGLFTLFAGIKSMKDSANDGIAFISAAGDCRVRIRGSTEAYRVGKTSRLDPVICSIIDCIYLEYGYLIIQGSV